MLKEQTPASVQAYRTWQLARMYGVSVKTFKKWLVPFKGGLLERGYQEGQRIFTISQVTYLFQDNILGKPS